MLGYALIFDKYFMIFYFGGAQGRAGTLAQGRQIFRRQQRTIWVETSGKCIENKLNI